METVQSPVPVYNSTVAQQSLPKQGKSGYSNTHIHTLIFQVLSNQALVLFMMSNFYFKLKA